MAKKQKTLTRAQEYHRNYKQDGKTKIMLRLYNADYEFVCKTAKEQHRSTQAVMNDIIRSYFSSGANWKLDCVDGKSSSLAPSEKLLPNELLDSNEYIKI